ncbi:hypothetical protein SETIT_3G229600v2 [Setaria italica]|uniref:CASP-like protein n=1 Tax=Setaria italica TaxID=4555 RepID=K3ZCY4_SETIT|nr:uncharacterized protein LOC101755258 [Setaria italica]RCV17561.1 hypothetical protein SETIT_3G229600v2 [Setaria italica]
MDTSVIALSVVVLLFAVASAVLGFIAETTKLNPDEIKYSGGVCVYPAKPAYALGICAAALLAAAQIIASVAGVSGCFKPQGGAPGPKRKKAVSSAVLSWILAVVAVASYAQGVVWNDAATTRDAVTDGWFIKCHYLKGAVFRRAALLGLAAAVLGICAYAILRERPAGDEPKPDGQQPAVGEVQNTRTPPPQVQAHPQV